MNPNVENIENDIIIENIVNNVFNLGIDLGPPPQMIRHNPPNYGMDDDLIADREFPDLGPLPQMVRHPSYDEYEEVGDVELIADGEFPDFQHRYDTPNDFVMPTPCPKCYQVCCNGDCSEEKEELAPLALTRVLTSVAYYYYKPGQEEPGEEDLVLPSIPPPLTRSFTNSHWPQDLPQYRQENQDKRRSSRRRKTTRR
jgi:hypothetical protein